MHAISGNRLRHLASDYFCWLCSVSCLCVLDRLTTILKRLALVLKRLALVLKRLAFILEPLANCLHGTYVA